MRNVAIINLLWVERKDLRVVNGWELESCRIELTEGIMLKILIFAGLFIVLTLVACAGNDPTATISAQDSVIVVPTQTYTFTPEPSSTTSLTPPSTATVTVTSTATVTPENFVLADSGYDIADVRITYQNESTAIV